MYELKDAKFSVTVDGANVLNESTPPMVEIDKGGEKILLVIKIGKNKIQELKIVIERGVFVEEEK